jgi:hypothetical protein
MLATPEDGRHVAAIVELIGKDIPQITIDGIATAALDDEAPRRRKGEGHRRRPERSRSAAPETKPQRRDNVTPFPRPPAPRRPEPRRATPERDRAVVGFGDDLPAFLARPPRVAGRR